MSLKSITDAKRGEDRAVSPVIGVILMVAITVILAAVIGTFVLDLGQSAGNSAPSASLSVTANPSGDGNLTISHKGGDGLDESRTQLIVEDSSGDTAVWNANSSSTSFSVGGESTIDTNGTGADTMSWGGSPLRDASTGGISGFDSGEQLSVTLIDTETQRVIYETTITA